MKQSCKAIVVLSFILAVSANTLFAQPYWFDQNGNGTRYAGSISLLPLSFEVAPDPSGGITSSSVLIYSLGFPVVSGDVALMEPGGTTVADLLRFFTPAGGTTSDVIFYSQPDGTLAGVGIPSSANPIQISDVSPETVWNPANNQPGASTGAVPVYASFEYDINTEAPEPSSTTLLLVAIGIWLTAWGSRREVFPDRKGLWP